MLFTSSGRIYLLRYEDLCINSHEVINRLMDFLDLKSHALIDKFIDQHTSKYIANPFGTYRNSKYTAFKWINILNWDYIQSVQKTCSAPMKLLGYNLMTNIAEERKRNNFRILVKTAKDLWPDDSY